MTRQSLGSAEDFVITVRPVRPVEVGNSDRLERAFTHNDNSRTGILKFILLIFILANQRGDNKIMRSEHNFANLITY